MEARELPRGWFLGSQVRKNESSGRAGDKELSKGAEGRAVGGGRRMGEA